MRNISTICMLCGHIKMFNSDFSFVFSSILKFNPQSIFSISNLISFFFFCQLYLIKDIFWNIFPISDVTAVYIIRAWLLNWKSELGPTSINICVCAGLKIDSTGIRTPYKLPKKVCTHSNRWINQSFFSFLDILHSLLTQWHFVLTVMLKIVWIKKKTT